MSQLEPLIADLALILICAGAMTLLFKRLKQPVVLGLRRRSACAAAAMADEAGNQYL